MGESCTQHVLSMKQYTFVDVLSCCSTMEIAHMTAAMRTIHEFASILNIESVAKLTLHLRESALANDALVGNLPACHSFLTCSDW